MRHAADTRKKLQALKAAGRMNNEEAAAFVQKLWRGYKARCEFDKKLAAVFDEMEKDGFAEED